MSLDLTPENAASFQHKEWLAHPVTQQLLKNLDKHKQSFVKALSVASGNTLEPEVSFRIHAYGIRTTDGIVAMITNTDKFLEQSSK